MDVRMIEKLKDKLCEELENVSRKSQMSATDLDSIHKLIVSIEKLMKIEKMEGGEYSQRGGSYGNGSYGNGSYGNGSYGNGSYGNGSYGNGSYSGESYNNGSYAKGGRGNYSRAEGTSMVKEHIRKMMDENEISGNDRRTLERAMEILG